MAKSHHSPSSLTWTVSTDILEFDNQIITTHILKCFSFSHCVISTSGNPMFLALSLMRTVSDSETGCYINTLQKEQLWKFGVRSISANRGYKGLETLCTYPNIKRGTLHTYLYMSFVILSLASDVELNPGPRTPIYPCQICRMAATWGQKGVSYLVLYLDKCIKFLSLYNLCLLIYF
jgi:hypothetical protein